MAQSVLEAYLLKRFEVPQSVLEEANLLKWFEAAQSVLEANLLKQFEVAQSVKGLSVKII